VSGWCRAASLFGSWTLSPGSVSGSRSSPAGPGQFALLFIDVNERKRAEQAAVAQFKLAEADAALP